MAQERKGMMLPNGWEAVSKIGAGSFGNVYRARRVIGQHVEWAAVKHISVPRDQNELNAIYAELGTKDYGTINRYLSENMQDMLDEYFRMKSLQGHTNIVACHDIQQIPKRGGIGFDVFIWMELLEGLDNRRADGRMNRAETIRMGMDICQALSLLKSKGIVHRDIKPQNILVNEHGDYKLGDFGSARGIKGTSTLMSVKGTLSYMSPEIMQGRPADFTSDIYSLGLVLHRLMNDNRPPFIPEGTLPSAHAMEEANARRVSGEPLPMPVHADEAFAEVILKACAYKPEDRWQTPEELFDALKSLTDDPGYTALNRPEARPATPEGDARNNTSGGHASTTAELPGKGKKGGKRLLILLMIAGLLILYLVLGAVIGWPPFSRKAEQSSGPADPVPDPDAVQIVAATSTPTAEQNEDPTTGIPETPIPEQSEIPEQDIILITPVPETPDEPSAIPEATETASPPAPDTAADALPGDMAEDGPTDPVLDPDADQTEETTVTPISEQFEDPTPEIPEEPSPEQPEIPEQDIIQMTPIPETPDESSAIPETTETVSPPAPDTESDALPGDVTEDGPMDPVPDPNDDQTEETTVTPVSEQFEDPTPEIPKQDISQSPSIPEAPDDESPETPEDPETASPPAPDTETEVLPGDVTGDGSVDMIDLIRLLKYLSNGTDEMDPMAGDLNQDGLVDLVDYIELQKLMETEE